MNLPGIRRGTPVNYQAVRGAQILIRVLVQHQLDVFRQGCLHSFAGTTQSQGKYMAAQSGALPVEHWQRGSTMIPLEHYRPGRAASFALCQTVAALNSVSICKQNLTGNFDGA